MTVISVCSWSAEQQLTYQDVQVKCLNAITLVYEMVRGIHVRPRVCCNAVQLAVSDHDLVGAHPPGMPAAAACWKQLMA